MRAHELAREDQYRSRLVELRDVDRPHQASSEGQADRILGQPRKLGIGTGAGQDLGIARGDHAPALALERHG